MIFIIRGHIRGSFNDDNLYNLLVRLSKLFELQIYIHTWSIQSSSLSWRWVEQNDQLVTEDRVRCYFRELSPLIKHILIDNEHDIEPIGSLEGGVAGSIAPLKGWKYYWAGKHRIAKYLYENLPPDASPVVSMRFDILNCGFHYDCLQITEFLTHYQDERFFKMNRFINNGIGLGCDNIYLGSVKTMYELTKQFYLKMDQISDANRHMRNQELIVPIINQLLILLD